MTQPTPYAPSASFDEWADELGLAGEALNVEFVDLKLTTDEILRSLVNMQRDDYGLKNRTVHLETLGSDVIAYLARLASETWIPRGNWATSTVYAVGDLVSQGSVTYVAAVAHTSGTFATDLAAGKWVALNTAPPEVPDFIPSILDVATLRTTEGSFHGQSLILSCYEDLGDAPPRLMWWDALSTADDDGGVVFEVSGVVIGRWRAAVEDPIDIRHYGAKLDNVTDDYDAWNRALNRALRIDTVFFNTRVAGRIVFPDVGKSYVSQTLNVKSRFTLMGSSSHIENSLNCCIRNPVDVGGIIINTYNTSGSTTVAFGSGADGSVIDGIAFEGGYWPGSTGTLGHGIRLRGRAIIRNVNVRGYALDGLHIRAAAGAGGDLEGNVNNFTAQDVRCQNNGRHGTLADLADANAGLLLRVDGDSNGGYGVYDSSFLGNTVITAHSAGNTTGAYKADSAAPSTWLGCYEESGQPASDFAQATLVLSGIQNANPPLANLGVILTPAQGFLRNHRGYESFMLNTAGDDFYIRLGGNPDNGDVLYAAHEVYSPLVHRLRYTSDGNLNLDYSNSGVALKVTGPVTTYTFGRASIVPHATLLPKLFVGSVTDTLARMITTQAWPPASGEWAAGDVIFSLGIAAGADPGGMCTTTGVAGSTAVFKAFANLDA
jgi:hypothetical protein